ncbi:MAG TPA: hypothetical protein VLA92_02375, partial [Candidatus Saccharimonadales bacterium]|nr:hypothetical protein [Candidatus Saccharimonadales bacterium]
LLVKPEIDGTITREVQAMGYDVEIRQAIVVGPEDDSRPGGCNHSEPSYDDIMLRTNTSATRRQ